jgi:hypothetical protein
MTTNTSSAFDSMRDRWAQKSLAAIDKEIESMRRHVQRHSAAYAWHGKGVTPPGALADGDKISALREAREIVTKTQGGAA